MTNNATNNSGSSTDHKPTVKEYIVYYLYKQGRSTVNEIATGIDYSHDYTREAATDLKENDEIEGEKTDPIVGCSLNGGLIVLTASRKRMIRDLRGYAPHFADRPKNENMTVDEIHDLIKKHAESITQLGKRWEFWYPPTPVGASSSEEAGAEADD